MTTSSDIAPAGVVIAGSDPQSISAVGKSSILDLLQVVADNLRLLVLAPLAAGLLGLGMALMAPPTFTAITKFMLPQQQQGGAAAMLAGLGALGGLGTASILRNPADMYIGLLRSSSLQEALIYRGNLLEHYETRFHEDARKMLDSHVQIVFTKDGLITIIASDTDPQFATQLANSHVEELVKLMNRLALTEAQQRRLFFEKQMADAKDHLVKAEHALAASGVNSSALKSTGAAVSAVAQLKGQIAAQEVKLASMRGYRTESAPDFKQAQTELSAWRAQLRQAEKAQPIAVAASAGESDYITKFRDFKYFENLFETFAKQYEMARIDESREGAIIQVVDQAHLPERSRPKNGLIPLLMMVVTGLAILIFVFVRQAFRRAAKTPATAEKITRLRHSLRRALGKSALPKAKTSDHVGLTSSLRRRSQGLAVLMKRALKAIVTRS
jgi:capsule polysaccharide export protein KpsE/RkpR